MLHDAYPPAKSRYATKPYPVEELQRRAELHAVRHPEPAPTPAPRALFLLRRTAEVVKIVWHRRRFAELPFNPVWRFNLEQVLAELDAGVGVRGWRGFDALVVYLQQPSCWRRFEALLERSRGTPVMALTAAGGEALGRRAFERGALAHLALDDLPRPLLGLSLHIARLRRLAAAGEAQSSSTARALRIRIKELKGFSRNGYESLRSAKCMESP